jgi:hypothetical protein
VIDARIQAVLQSALRRESLSLLRYASEAYPWTGVEERTAGAKLREVMDEDQEAVGGLVRFLAENKLMPPYLGSYPMAYTSLSFVSLDYLLPALVEAQRRHIAALARDVAAVGDPAARESLQHLLDTKRRHLSVLEGLAAARPANAVR